MAINKVDAIYHGYAVRGVIRRLICRYEPGTRCLLRLVGRVLSELKFVTAYINYRGRFCYNEKCRETWNYLDSHLKLNTVKNATFFSVINTVAVQSATNGTRLLNRQVDAQ